MDTASASNFFSGSMNLQPSSQSITFVDSLAPARLALSGQSPPRSPDRRWCLHQDLRRLATNQYEIFGLTPYLLLLGVCI
ncbi:MAG: hypothetical protein QE493_06715 [Verrucomicrobiae bacterium]|nr:hypothetical protein [Verrucomicrobiae bacterium]